MRDVDSGNYPDPVEMLAMLDQAQNSAEADMFFDPGPRWKPWALAVSFAAHALEISSEIELLGLGGLFGSILIVIANWSDISRRRIEPRQRGSFARRKFAFVSTLVAVCFSFCVWGVLIFRSSWVEFELIPLGALIGFFFSAGVFNVQRKVVQRRYEQMVQQ